MRLRPLCRNRQDDLGPAGFEECLGHAAQVGDGQVLQHTVSAGIGDKPVADLVEAHDGRGRRKGRRRDGRTVRLRGGAGAGHQDEQGDHHDRRRDGAGE